MSQLRQIHVSSEIGALKRVIVHRPDEGIARITPKRAEELLFDDIIHLPNMQEEHDIFTAVLKSFLGEEHVLETQQLITEALSHSTENREIFIDRIMQFEELPRKYSDWLRELDDAQLGEVLITGYHKKRDILLFDPIPNFIFTRDIAVTIKDHIIITSAAKSARYRENVLTRLIFGTHPMFEQTRRENKCIDLNDVELFPPSRKGEFVCLEGGDVMIIDADHLMIGVSERTNEHAFCSLRDALFEKGVVKNIAQVNIPAERSYMHIDTVFTQVDKNHFCVFKPLVIEGLGSEVEVFRQDGSMVEYPTVATYLCEEINPRMEFILSGNGESPYQEREQWTDGCNLVTIKPGVALTYDRNPKTEEAFRDAGFDVIPALEYLRRVSEGGQVPAELEKTIITLPSNELSRARGGSHCMTCPVERDPIT